MNPKRKMYLCFIFILFMISFSTTGCGQKTTDDAYEYRNTSTIISKDISVSSISIKGEYIYFALQEPANDQTNTTSLYQKNIYQEESQQLPITIENNSDIYSICGVEDGLWTLLITSYKSAAGKLEDKYELREYDFSGTILNESEDINQMMVDNDETAILSFRADEEGRLCLIGASGTIYSMNPDGTKVKTIAVANVSLESAKLYLQDQMVVYNSSLDINNIRKIDLSANTLEELSKKDIYYTTEQYGLNQYKNMGKVRETILNWLDNGIFTSQIQTLSILKDGTILVITLDFTDQKYLLKQNLLKKVEKDKEEQSGESSRITITYGVANALDDTVKKDIVNFNTQNEKYKIEVVNYLEDGMNMGDATTKLNAAIAAGNGPDLINVLDFDYQTYATNGVFENLYPYITNDSTFHKEDYFENILTCYSYKNELFAIPRNFDIDTLAGSKEDFPTQGWTLSEMYKFMENHPEINTLFEAGPQSMLQELMVCYMDDFYNLETGSCNFNSQEFVDLLKFCKTYAYKDGEPQDNVKNKTQLLTKIYSLDYIQYQKCQQIFEGDISFMGYPDDKGNGARISPLMSALAIGSYSKQKAGAWEFIKYSLSKEEQGNFSIDSYPIRKDSYFALMNQQINMKVDTEYDENGNLIKVPFTYNFSYAGLGSYTYEYYPPTQKMVNEITDVIEHTDTIMDIDINVWNIIVEEDNYLKGDGDPWDMAEKIQNRVQLYVNESR